MTPGDPEPTPYHWWHAVVDYGACFRNPANDAVLRKEVPGPAAPLPPSPDHGWLVDTETDSGRYYPLAEIRTWPRA